MTVRCAGDAKLIEQTGEKQDFECELTLLGFRHEHFLLRVQTPATTKASAWSHDYSVTVVDTASGRSRVYAGGPRLSWVRDFAADASGGAFGAPDARFAGSPAPLRPGESAGQRCPR